MSQPRQFVSVGLDLSTVPDLKNSLLTVLNAKYEFISAPLSHPQLKREFLNDNLKVQSQLWTRPDMILCGSDWSTSVIGKLSPYINVDSQVPWIKVNSEEMLNQELNLASHLALPAITFKLKSGIENNINLARLIYGKMLQHSAWTLWLEVPMENPAKQKYYYQSDEKIDVESPWEWYNGFRKICNFERRLAVALIVSSDIPSAQEIERWQGEPIRALILPTSIFLTNKKGFPVLSKSHQALIKKFVSLNVQFVLTGANHYDNVSYYHSYLDYLWKVQLQSHGALENFAKGYEDYLQCPLQPLMDNLESQTYEVFEKDPVKYTAYQDAIEMALKSTDKKNFTIMVVGAGRGPLVRAALNAADIAKKSVRVYAVEKNPNAVLTLMALQRSMWAGKVKVISCDMRDWEAPEKADIIVSELLGSFGDNELSPECLDGIQKFLHDDGISIPYSYTSYFAPVQSARLYNEVKSSPEKEKSPLAPFETPYVVHLSNKYDIAPVQPLFTFEHPNRASVIDNSRYGENTFKVSQASVLHGFAGYFTAHLFRDIKISIEPENATPEMFSWFPIFFPLKDPVHLTAGDEVVAHFWRNCSKKNVWYEWCISQPIQVPIHNPNGRSSTIGL